MRVLPRRELDFRGFRPRFSSIFGCFFRVFFGGPVFLLRKDNIEFDLQITVLSVQNHRYIDVPLSIFWPKKKQQKRRKKQFFMIF